MEWVEFTASSLEEATQLATEQLGLGAGALEIEVLEEPVAGLFGRVRGTAKIRARAAGAKVAKATKSSKAAKPSTTSKESKSIAAADEPTAARSSQPSRTARPKASGSALAAVAAVAAAPTRPAARDGRSGRPTTASAPRPPRPPRVNDEPVDVDAVVESSTRFLQGLLEAAGLHGSISHRVVDEQTVEMSMAGDSLGMLVGPKGQTLLAAQELLRTFVHHDTGGRSGRLMLDVAGYREKRRAALQIFTKQVAESVVATSERRVLEPMNAVDRKVVHDTVATIDGVSSLSEGEDPHRYVVLLPE